MLPFESADARDEADDAGETRAESEPDDAVEESSSTRAK